MPHQHVGTGHPLCLRERERQKSPGGHSQQISKSGKVHNPRRCQRGHRAAGALWKRRGQESEVQHPRHLNVRTLGWTSPWMVVLGANANAPAGPRCPHVTRWDAPGSATYGCLVQSPSAHLAQVERIKEDAFTLWKSENGTTSSPSFRHPPAQLAGGAHLVPWTSHLVPWTSRRICRAAGRCKETPPEIQ